jgi:hypothetical protein
VKDFSTIAATLTEIMKKSVRFKWNDKQDKAFNLLKDKISSTHVLALPDFTKAFRVECDASGIGIGLPIWLGFFSYKDVTVSFENFLVL